MTAETKQGGSKPLPEGQLIVVEWNDGSRTLVEAKSDPGLAIQQDQNGLKINFGILTKAQVDPRGRIPTGVGIIGPKAKGVVRAADYETIEYSTGN